MYDLGEAQHDRKKKRPVESVIQNIDIFSISEQFRYTCLALSHQSIYDHKYEIPNLKQKIHNSNFNYEEHPNLIVYYTMYLTQIEPHIENHYYKLKNLLVIHGQKFPFNEAEFVYFSTLNYCIRKINRGKENFRLETFDVYKDLLRKNILTFKGSLSPWHFRNICTIGLQVGEIEWVSSFIEEYEHTLPISFRANAISFNKAQVAFKKKDYTAVLRILSLVEYEDITYNLNSKTIQFMTYYETGEIEALFSLADSFRTYLGRHKDIAKNKRLHYSNLIKLTKRLLKAKENEKHKLDLLLTEVNELAGTGIASEKWLREKIAERLAKAK